MLTGGGYHPFDSCAGIARQFLADGGFGAAEVTEDRSALTRLDGYDAVVVYTQGGRLEPAEEAGLTDFVRAGGGFVGIHCANDSFKENDAYMEMIGTQFASHGHMVNVQVEADPDAERVIPRTAKSFHCFDEFYITKPRTQAELMPFHHGWWKFERHPLGYTRPYGKGQVFYTALGHDERAFRNPNFQETVTRGLAFVTGQLEKPPIRFGLVGFGPHFKMGQRHSNDINATAGLVVTAACDLDPARLEAAREHLGSGLATFTDYKEMAASGLVDVAVVILPHNLHHRVTCDLLKAGLGVVVEKPMAITVEECDDMVNVAREKGLFLSVYQSRHWDADMWTIRKVVEEGLIGEVFSVEHDMQNYRQPRHWWRSHKEISGGIIYDFAGHGFEKIFQILPRTNAKGEPINRNAIVVGNNLKRVWCDTTNEDYVRIYVKFDTGFECQMIQSSISAVRGPRWRVTGTRGGLTAEGDGVHVTTVSDDGEKRHTVVPYVEGLSWQSFYANVADHLQFGAKLVITPALARATIKCVRAGELSSETNQAVPVEIDF
jgi:predicted dehydrogenase/type 1 glutamine amidotransferase